MKLLSLAIVAVTLLSINAEAKANKTSTKKQQYSSEEFSQIIEKRTHTRKNGRSLDADSTTLVLENKAKNVLQKK